MEEKSKSQIKREMTELQKLGEKLAALPPSKLNKIPIPEKLLDAIQKSKQIKQNLALRRHMQYIGAVMREIDVKPIQHALAAQDFNSRFLEQKFKQFEEWRHRLIAGDQVLFDEIANSYANTDRQYLQQLIRNARKEKQNNPEGKMGKSGRQIFQYLQKLCIDEIAVETTE